MVERLSQYVCVPCTSDLWRSFHFPRRTRLSDGPFQVQSRVRARPERGDAVQVPAHAAWTRHSVRQPRVERQGAVCHAAGVAQPCAVCPVRRCASPLRLQLLDVPARPLHAGLQQRQRLKHLDKFTECDAGVLVATDVAARGLDIPDVRAVRSRHPPHLTSPHTRALAESSRVLTLRRPTSGCALQCAPQRGRVRSPQRPHRARLCRRRVAVSHW